MIHIVTSANRALYEAQIEETYRLRHDFYVKERGWKDLEKPDGREIDQYDDERTVYLFHIDEDDHVDGSFRLYPTDEKSLMADRFSHLVDGGNVPHGLDIYEITRWFMSPASRREAGKARSPMGAKLLCGLMEFAVRRRLKSYNLVCDTFFMPRMLAAGWDVKPLGLPQDYPEGTAIAVTIGVGNEMLEHSRKLMGMQHPITYEAPPPLDGRIFTSPSLGGRWAAAYESIQDERLRRVLTSTAERAAMTDLELAFATCEAALTRLSGDREPVLVGGPNA